MYQKTGLTQNSHISFKSFRPCEVGKRVSSLCEEKIHFQVPKQPPVPLTSRYETVKAYLSECKPVAAVKQKLSQTEIARITKTFENARESFLEGLPTTVGMRRQDRQKLCLALGQTDSDVFSLVSLGEKPSMVVCDEGIDALNSIRKEGFDTLLRAKRPQDKIHFDNLFFFNKKATQKVIEKNKDFYTKRLNLPAETTKEEIYKHLLSPKSPLLDENGFSDIIGITFGYPKNNSLIYHLEHRIGNFFEKRQNIPEFKKELKSVLRSESSPYKDFDEVFKKELEGSIDKINEIQVSDKLLLKDKKQNSYPFISYVSETSEIKRICDNYRRAAKKLDAIEENNKVKQLGESIDGSNANHGQLLAQYWA